MIDHWLDRCLPPLTVVLTVFATVAMAVHAWTTSDPRVHLWHRIASVPTATLALTILRDSVLETFARAAARRLPAPQPARAPARRRQR